MKRKEYNAGAVKMSFWFVEFRKVVELLGEEKSTDQIKDLALNENLFAAPTALRANQIYQTVTGRIKALDKSFIPLFVRSDLADSDVRVFFKDKQQQNDKVAGWIGL